MYLARTLTWRERRCEMVGVIPGDIVMCDRPQGRGYVRLRETARAPWPMRRGSEQPADFGAHEFHYSRIVNLPPETVFAYQVLRGTGIDGQRDGIVYKHVLASYCHLRHGENNDWARRFVDYVRALLVPSQEARRCAAST